MGWWGSLRDLSKNILKQGADKGKSCFHLNALIYVICSKFWFRFVYDQNFVGGRGGGWGGGSSKGCLKWGGGGGGH